jgi:hypothetical protein
MSDILEPHKVAVLITSSLARPWIVHVVTMRPSPPPSSRSEGSDAPMSKDGAGGLRYETTEIDAIEKEK